uniref:Triple gene block protein 2 n=1 Tax=Banana mild mosaic virus TaxID=148879 RepID=A0A8E5NVN5_9VIRU|nr:triple gene block protein 2 [Banmivirus BanMMV]
MNSSVERLKQLIESSGFIATSNIITDKIVIHGVAGSGKSTLTKKLAELDEFNVVNTLSKEEIDLSGQYIKKDLVTFENKVNVLDEYLSVDCHKGFQVLLADPFQYRKKPYKANFVKNISHRFKRELIPILSEIGINIEATEEGLEILRGSAFEIEPKGKVIAIETEVAEYVSKHGLEVHNSSCIQGQEFDAVTFYHAKELKELERSELYTALTRVKKELRILQL